MIKKQVLMGALFMLITSSGIFCSMPEKTLSRTASEIVRENVIAGSFGFLGGIFPVFMIPAAVYTRYLNDEVQRDTIRGPITGTSFGIGALSGFYVLLSSINALKG